MEKELDAILEKVKDANSYSKVREILSDDDLALFGIYAAQADGEFEEEDECLVKDILLLLKASRRSTRHSLFVLEQAKDALLKLSFLMP